jgi:Tfp pilus assembly protein FimT
MTRDVFLSADSVVALLVSVAVLAILATFALQSFS